MSESLSSLTGTERAMAQDFSWAIATFTWAISKYRTQQKLAATRPNVGGRQQAALAEIADAILEQLENWDPSHRAN